MSSFPCYLYIRCEWNTNLRYSYQNTATSRIQSLVLYYVSSILRAWVSTIHVIFFHYSLDSSVALAVFFTIHSFNIPLFFFSMLHVQLRLEMSASKDDEGLNNLNVEWNLAFETNYLEIIRMLQMKCRRVSVWEFLIPHTTFTLYHIVYEKNNTISW